MELPEIKGSFRLWCCWPDGNLYAESGLRPNNLQNTYEGKFGMADAEYTELVDKGRYTNFVRDSAGYGLAQWTYWSRKEALLAYAKASKKSIGDLEMQLDFLLKELSSYGLLGRLKTVSTVLEASNIVLLEFEKPASMNTAATQPQHRSKGPSMARSISTSTQRKEVSALWDSPTAPWLR